MSISHAKFSRQAAFLAKNSADWAADCLMLDEDLSRPMRNEPVERYLKDMRGRLNMIEKVHSEKEGQD